MGVPNPCCLLCNQSTSSALIGTGNGKSEELSQLFEVFCDYLKLDPDRKLRNAYPGRLFPFCPACSFNVYQLFDYHKEKVRILGKLSQVVVSMAVLILESDESASNPESSHNVGADPAAETLAGQIAALRKSVVRNYSPKLRLKPIKPPEIKAVNAKAFSRTKNIKIGSKHGINKVSADVSSENILESSLGRRLKGSEDNLFVKIENISDSDADFGTHECQDDSMNIDYSNDGDANDLNASKSEESDDSKSDYSGDEGLVREGTNDGATAKGNKKRPSTYPVKIDENTYSLRNYKYKVNGSEFKCEACPYTGNSYKGIRNHLYEMHFLHVPLIPEKPMDEYKVGKNEYSLGDKYNFKKVGEREFRCSTCKQTATTWSKMYNHIRELHYSPSKRRGQGAPRFRPKGVVVPLGDNEFEYFGFKYSVLPQGGHTCLTCGSLGVTLGTMQGHIRKIHADFLPKVPNKSLEDYEIHPSLFCLSRRYMFERTGDNCFECSFSDCNLVTPTWEEMYIHIRADHYFMLERSQKKQREARRVEKEKLSASSLASNRKKKVVKKEKVVGNIGSYSDADFGVGEAQDGSMDLDYENDGDSDDLKSTKSEESDDSTSESSGDEGNLRPRTKFRVTATGRKLRQPAFPVKIDENTYSLRNYKYKVNGSEFKCETCPYTKKSYKRMRNHLYEMHVRNVPPIPEKPMDEYKVSKNEYSLGDKYNFKKVGEKEFRCSTCKQTGTIWSKMYAHIRELHFGPTKNKTVGLRGEPLRFRRPYALVTPLGDKEFECLSFKFSVLPHGSHKCVTCGYITVTRRRMAIHIRGVHADFLPKVPAKSLEDYEISPNLFCLANRYLFERTANDCFDCTFSDCNLVTPTWEEMYAHIERDHYFPLERSQKRHRKPTLRSKKGRPSASSLAPNPPVTVLTEEEAGKSVGEPGSNSVSIQADQDYPLESSSNNPGRKSLASSASQDMQQGVPAEENDEAPESSNTPDPTRKEAEGETHLPEAAEGGNIPKSVGEEEEAQTPGTQTSGQTVRLTKIREKKTTVPTRDAWKESQVLADIEISPGRYSYNDFEFHSAEDGQFICDSCDAFVGTEYTSSIFTHIRTVHMRSTGLRKTGPNEFLLSGIYPATRAEAGGFMCRVEGCESRTGFATLARLKAHVKRHAKAKNRKRRVLSLEEKQENLRRTQEETQRALSNFQVGPNQYNYKGIDFVFRDDMYHCGSCGFETRIRIVPHILDKHVGINSTDKQPKRKTPARSEPLSFEEVSPDEFLIAGELRAYRLPDGTFKCGVDGCDSISGKKDNLVRHIRGRHRMSPEMCELCGKVCKNILLLEYHKAAHHEEGDEQECPQCGKVQRNSFVLKIHLQSHKARAVPKPRQVCHVCGKAYINAGGLRSHIKSHHSEVKPTFPCDQCGRVYSDAVSLRVHMRVEHLGGGEKTHPCPVCQKQFKYKETVRRHILVVHEGKKSSEVYKRKQRPRSSAAGTSTVRKRTKRKKPETDEDHTDSSMEDTADDNDTVDFQKLIDF